MFLPILLKKSAMSLFKLLLVIFAKLLMGFL
jgi:hypothetical protein